MSIEYKTPDQIRAMARSGHVLRGMLDAVRDAIKPGVTTKELDEVAAAYLAANGATSNFLGYMGYPATICTSVNDEVVHGIPSSRVLQAGDLISVDGGAIVDGWHSDSAFTAIVGEGDPADYELSQACERAMWAGIAATATGKRLGDVGAAIEASVVFEETDYGVVENYTGHGIGTQMHMEPEVLNYDARARGPRLKAGMCLAIEPMLVRGRAATKELDDGWTVVTADGSRAAHWEHTVAILSSGIRVLTAADGGAAGLAPYGVTPVEL